MPASEGVISACCMVPLFNNSLWRVWSKLHSLKLGHHKTGQQLHLRHDVDLALPAFALVGVKAALRSFASLCPDKPHCPIALSALGPAFQFPCVMLHKG